MSTTELLNEMDGATAQEWMEKQIHFSGLGQYTLAAFCAEQAEAAYAAQDEEN